MSCEIDDEMRARRKPASLAEAVKAVREAAMEAKARAGSPCREHGWWSCQECDWLSGFSREHWLKA